MTNQFEIKFDLNGNTWTAVCEGLPNMTIDIYCDDVWATSGRIDADSHQIIDAPAPLDPKVYEHFDAEIWLRFTRSRRELALTTH